MSNESFDENLLLIISFKFSATKIYIEKTIAEKLFKEEPFGYFEKSSDDLKRKK